MFHHDCEWTNEWRACLLDWWAFLESAPAEYESSTAMVVTAFMLSALCALTFSLPQNKGQKWGCLVDAHEKQTAQGNNSHRKQPASSFQDKLPGFIHSLRFIAIK